MRMLASVVFRFKLAITVIHEKGKFLREHNQHEENTASVLLKLFINCHERSQTTESPFSNV